MPGVIRVGTCSWTDKTLLRSGFYPESAKTPALRLAHYASQFDVVEVDSSFYALPGADNAVRWMACTPRDFVFGIKSFAIFTFHRSRIAALPRWLQRELGMERSAWVTRDDLSSEQRLRLYEEFLATVMILHRSKRLAYLLFQFPPRWQFSPRSLAYIRRVRRVSGPLPLAVEIRNNTWLSPKNRETFFAVLRDENIAYVTADRPRQEPLAGDWPVTAQWGSVVRFHGRNEAGWSNPRASVWERFDYEYNERELREWEDAIWERSRAVPVFLMYNNCVSDKAVRGANLMKKILGLGAPPNAQGRQTRLEFDAP